MDEVRKLLGERAQYLSEVVAQTKKSLKGAPEGKLRAIRNKGNTQYYYRKNSKDHDGAYIRKKEIKFIQALARKEYNQKLLQIACKEQETIEQFLAEYHPEQMIEVYQKIPVEKRQLIEPRILSNEEYAAKWKEVEYKSKEIFTEEDNAIYTENGEIVRSKSEKILADKFKTMAIPYHYEKPLYLNGYGTVYPDFTVLNKHTRKTYYWEHLGMMDNPEYCEKAIKKIETMAKNEIVQGRNLILTYETSTHPLNTRTVEVLIEEYLL